MVESSNVQKLPLSRPRSIPKMGGAKMEPSMGRVQEIGSKSSEVKPLYC